MDRQHDWLDLDALGALLRFPLHGKAAQNRFLVGSGLLLVGMFIPLLPAIVVYGYLLRLMRGVMRGGPLELPSWESLGELFGDGLKTMVVAFAYLLPGTLAMLAGMVAYFVAGPFSMLVLRPGGRLDEAEAATFVLALFGGMALMFIGLSLGFFLSFLGAVPLPAALARLADSGRLGDAFQLRTLWRLIGAQRWRYFAAWVVLMGVVGIVYIGYTLIYFTWILCAVALFFLAPAMFYALTIGAAVFGRFYAQSGAPLTASTPVVSTGSEGDPVL